MNGRHLKLTVAGAAALLFSASGFAAGTTNMFGGPAYLGQPNLKLTAALVKAGGGPAHFSTAKALTSMLGKKTVNAEVAKLDKQYGKKNVHQWLKGENAVVELALKDAKQKGIKLPHAPANLHGKKLVVALVQAGTTKNGTFWAGHFYDKLVSHGIHNEVMAQVNKNPKLGVPFDRDVHKFTNQTFYDIAHALGEKHVKLASLH
jgi:hypothetical protein